MFIIIIIGIIFIFYLFKSLQKGISLPNWFFISFTIFILIFIFYPRLEKGGKLVLGDKAYYYVTYGIVEEVIVKNTDKLAFALMKVYEKYYEREIIDASKESDNVKFIHDNKGVAIRIKLKYVPVENTISSFVNAGFQYAPSKEKNEEDFYGDGFMTIYFSDYNTLDELKKVAEEKKLTIELRYFRKQ